MFQVDVSTAVSSLPTPATAGTQGYFTNGNPVSGIPATVLEADFTNMVMMELVNIVLAGGLTPSKTTYTQVRDALKVMFSAISGSSTQLFNVAPPAASTNAVNLGQFLASIGASGYIKVPILVAGVLQNAILEWGQVSQAGQSTTTYTFPLAFPNACFLVLAGKGSSVTITGEYAAGAQATSKSQFQIANTAASTGAQGLWWFAIGY